MELVTSLLPDHLTPHMRPAWIPGWLDVGIPAFLYSPDIGFTIVQKNQATQEYPSRLLQRHPREHIVDPTRQIMCRHSARSGTSLLYQEHQYLELPRATVRTAHLSKWTSVSKVSDDFSFDEANVPRGMPPCHGNSVAYQATTTYTEIRYKLAFVFRQILWEEKLCGNEAKKEHHKFQVPLL